MIAFSFILGLLAARIDVSGYGNRVARLPVATAGKLAEASAPDRSGAIGRNKRAYFHVRFQRGMHHIADYGIATKQRGVVDRFLTAVEYSLAQQLPSGDFRLVVPASLKEEGEPNIADRTSGVAFFASSLGLGIHALETNNWFANSRECARLRQRLIKMTPQLRLTLDFLVKHQESLEAADKYAPNRLLFDALAFETLGQILDDKTALHVASSFVEMAIKQVDPVDGYFIEGGGFDSSYNAVATALTLRLLMAGHVGHELESIGTDAIRWQQGRILSSGEVSTEGNARVRPGRSGESFLGREKDVDVGHVVEAFMLASMALPEAKCNELAVKVLAFYESKRARGR